MMSCFVFIELNTLVPATSTELQIKFQASIMKEILDRTLPFYDNGFQLGFTAFLADVFLFTGHGVYGPETYAYTILNINWFEDYCSKNDLTLTLHSYTQELVGVTIEAEVGTIKHQNFLTMSKKE